jgi:diguanylate cyclase (GGDEF)-like protein
MLLLFLGPTAMGWYVATSSSVVTSTVCLAFAALQLRLRSSIDELAAAAGRDPLTGLLNRRGLAERFPGLRAATRHDERVAVVLVDVDSFKHVNDVHGHDAGDGVLVALADVMRATAREGDLVSRQGGEELAWVGTCADAQHAAAAAERLRAAVATTPMPHGERLTVSAGVAFSTDATQTAPDAEALSRLLVRADAALYEAKRAGRDRVVLAPPPAASGPGRDGAPAPQVRDGGSRRAGAGSQRA